MIKPALGVAFTFIAMCLTGCAQNKPPVVGLDVNVYLHPGSSDALSVCLLERGQAFPPQSFPRAPYKLKRNFWDPSGGFFGMFNIWSFKGMGALVSSGLGGGSLIYANVMLRKDEKWFVKEDIANG